ncbi:hypothetical protein TNCT_335371 [Trichonephila clavata]|uniref:Uncharacterized protein n=1 Tax=Trichonephila clavata TaxID=2740835 RepID=A0A8X6GEL5_TRICU|nr:hypothetical protein TNCT_335371 [Trichonephila clavata]
MKLGISDAITLGGNFTSSLTRNQNSFEIYNKIGFPYYDALKYLECRSNIKLLSNKSFRIRKFINFYVKETQHEGFL